MKRGTLSAHFRAYAYKRLADVEINPKRSNQHELNGARALKDMLGPSEVKLRTRFIYLSDRGDNLSQDGTITWYDSRHNHPVRSEYRLYYTSNEVMGKAQTGDLLIVGLLQNEQGESIQVFLFVAKGRSQIESELEWLFGFSASDSKSFTTNTEESLESVELGPQARALLEELGISVNQPSDDIDVEAMLSEFEGKWPSTRDLSRYARQLVDSNVQRDDADAAIRLWYETEERLFRAYEGALVGERVRRGFDSVDDFVSFS
ncbi:MAG: restriction endonuclease, partial [Ignavibacteria bacterium]